MASDPSGDGWAVLALFVFGVAAALILLVAFDGGDGTMSKARRGR